MRSLNLSLITTSLKIDMTYRFRVFIWMCSGFSWVIVYPNVWLAIYGSRTVIDGLTRTDLLTYFIGILVMEYMLQSYVEEDLHEQIRDGKISAILLKPIDFVRYFYFLHTGYRLVPATVYVLLATFAIVFFHVPVTLPHHWVTVPLFLTSLALGNLIAFNLKMIVSVAAFWIEEAEPVRVIYWIVSSTFMGWVGPIVLFPHWFQKLSAAIPWQYTLYFPVVVFMEVVKGRQALTGLGIAAVWLLAIVLIRRWAVRKSLQHFNAVGH